MSYRHDNKKTGNLVLGRFQNGIIACYGVKEDGKTDYDTGVKLIIKVSDIKSENGELCVKLLLNGPELAIVRYELIPKDQKEIIDDIIKNRKNSLEAKSLG